SFNEVEKGLELRLAPNGAVKAADAPPPSLAAQIMSELDQQRQAVRVAKEQLEESAMAAQSEQPALALGETPELDTPAQKALRSLVQQEEASGTEFWAHVEQSVGTANERIDSLQARVREIQSSVEKGSVADSAATSALKAIQKETQLGAGQDRQYFAELESKLQERQAQFRQELERLAQGDLTVAGADAAAPVEGGVPAEAVTKALEGLSKMLAQNTPTPDPVPVVVEGDMPVSPQMPAGETEVITNQLASLEKPVEPLLSTAVPAADLQEVVSVPLDLAAAQVDALADAAAAVQPETKAAEETTPEPAKAAASPETTEPAAASQEAPKEEASAQAEPPAPATEEAKPAEPAAATPAAEAPAAPEEASPAIEEKAEEQPEPAVVAEPEAPVTAQPAEAEPLAPPVAEPEPTMLADVSREQLPPGMDPLDQPVNIDFREMDLSAVVALLAKKAQVNVIAGTEIIGTVTADIRNVPLRQAMDMVLRMNGLGIVEEEGIFRIVPYEEAVAARRVTRMLVLENAQADDVKATLDGILVGAADAQLMTISANAATNVVLLSGPEERVAEFETLAKQLDVSEPAMPTVTEAIKLNYLEPGDAKPIVDTLITEELGKSEIDELGRHIVVTDMPVVVEQIRTLLKSVDIPVKQVAIEAMIVDAVMRDGSQTGVSWLLDAIRKYSSNGDLISDVSEAGFRSNLGVGFDDTGVPNASQLGTALDAAAITLGILTNDIRLNTVIAAETQSRNAEILANPSVVTVENQPATISIVQEFPYQEITQGLTGPPVSTTEFKDIGVTLEVTPRVTHEKDTIVNIRAKQSSVSGLTEDGIPIEDLREAETTLRAQDGRTIFIGGLRNVSDTHSVSKIPVLGDIPLLNVMFKNSNVEKINTELLIFLTCRVLGDSLPELTPSQQRENDKIDAVPQVPDSQRPLFKDYVKPQEMRDPIWKWRRSVH
ncbi:MAG: hypothetical protein IT364_10055, partial [Candidatus Hydrogenedentes bacterium]|nr:hypothetical protein [Candidatus Hydrogenedentota bacterium]